MAYFDDPVHDEFASWILGLAPYGGGDVGEVELLATKVKAGDDDSFFDALSALARRRIDEGDAAADMVSSDAEELFDALTCPKTFIEFADADGAGMHCEILNRSMANRQIIDWLDDTLAPPAR